MKIIGCLYLRKQSNGNLVGEFINNKTSLTITEIAELSLKSNNEFVGNYRSYWKENGEKYDAILTITNENMKYKLDWKGENISFFGEGFVCDNMLIAYYHD